MTNLRTCSLKRRGQESGTNESLEKELGLLEHLDSRDFRGCLQMSP